MKGKTGHIYPEWENTTLKRNSMKYMILTKCVEEIKYTEMGWETYKLLVFGKKKREKKITNQFKNVNVNLIFFTQITLNSIIFLKWVKHFHQPVF